MVRKLEEVTAFPAPGDLVVLADHSVETVSYIETDDWGSTIYFLSGNNCYTLKTIQRIFSDLTETEVRDRHPELFV